MKLSDCCGKPTYGSDIDPLCTECHEHCSFHEYIEVILCFNHPDREASYLRDEYIDSPDKVGICDECYARLAKLQKASLNIEQIRSE